MKGVFEINNGVILGSNKHVKGNRNTITGSNAKVYGHKNVVIGSNAYVEGDDNVITGSNAFAKGNNNRITGINARAEGLNNVVEANSFISNSIVGTNITISNGVVSYGKKEKKQKKEEEEEYITAPIDTEKDEEAKEGENTCVICLTSKTRCLVRPCNHLCLCIKCSSALCFGSKGDELKRVGEVYCPKCRTGIKSIEKVFE